MRIYDEARNDGTVAITDQVDTPMQGTYVGDDGATLAKGVVRPPLAAMDLDWFEETGVVRQAAFGKVLVDSPRGTFYRIRETGRERCMLDHNSILFNSAEPWEIIESDNVRLRNMSVRDLVSAKHLAVADAGIPLSLLIEPMAPWKMFDSIPWPGTRATAYGVEDINAPHEVFYLLPGSAEELFRRLRKAGKLSKEQRKIEDLIGSKFVVHRHPALPDASSSYYAAFAGVSMWASPCDANYGVIIPSNSQAWKAAGGDFDGDSASVLYPFELREPVQRISLRVKASAFKSDDVPTQMLEDATRSVQGLLGKVILASTRAFERGIEDDQLRIDAASAAQASVEAKKHAVDEVATSSYASFVFDAVRQELQVSGIDYVATLSKQVKDAVGETMKAEAWKIMATFARMGVWNRGSRTEAALSDRILILDQLFEDSGYLRACVRAELPASLRKEAQKMSTIEAVEYIEKLNSKMEGLLSEKRQLSNDPDEENREGRASIIAEDMRTVRRLYQVAAITGGGIATPRDMQLAILGYAPARTAATSVSAEVVSELKVSCREIIVNLFGTEWKDGTYKITDLTPIHPHRQEVTNLSEITSEVSLTVIKHTPGARSVRVHLKAVAYG
jgi:hypothetical protein